MQFFKYQGAGNDFIMLDNRAEKVLLSSNDITSMCNRKYGIGADGVILLEDDNDILRMRYFNADGSHASFCGNGGRCFALFAHHLDLSIKCNNVFLVTFSADDGKHEATIYSENRVQISMRSVENIFSSNSCGNALTVLDTGVPHGVIFTSNINDCNVVEDGRKIRSDKQFPDGINVDFVERISDDTVRLRTYERGVEGETDACGTGAVAAAIASVVTTQNPTSKDYLMHEIAVETKTTTLKVCFTLAENTVKNIILEGPAMRVFEGLL
jgi:diaminopimelate epimerase